MQMDLVVMDMVMKMDLVMIAKKWCNEWYALTIWNKWYVNMVQWKLEGKLSLTFLLQVCLIAFSCAISRAHALVAEEEKIFPL